VELIVIMKRQAEDLLLGNTDNQKGKEALHFILSLANERDDMDQIKKGFKFWIIYGTDNNLVVGIKNWTFQKLNLLSRTPTILNHHSFVYYLSFIYQWLS